MIKIGPVVTHVCSQAWDGLCPTPLLYGHDLRQLQPRARPHNATASDSTRFFPEQNILFTSTHPTRPHQSSQIFNPVPPLYKSISEALQNKI